MYWLLARHRVSDFAGPGDWTPVRARCACAQVGARNPRRTARAFSLIELVIVIVIIGILASIAVPRLSRGADTAAESALTANLQSLRNALELFVIEHGETAPTAGLLTNALTLHSNYAGTVFGPRDVATGVVYGPYLRAIPTLPVGENKGQAGFSATLGGTRGWVYDATSRSIRANCPDAEVDGSGKKYNSY